MNTFSIGGYSVSISIDREGGQIHAKAFCPICGSSEESADHGYGEKHASKITQGKIRTHLSLMHQITE